MITFTLNSFYAKEESSRPKNEKADGRDHVEHILSPTTEGLEVNISFSKICAVYHQSKSADIQGVKKLVSQFGQLIFVKKCKNCWPKKKDLHLVITHSLLYKVPAS